MSKHSLGWADPEQCVESLRTADLVKPILRLMRSVSVYDLRRGSALLDTNNFNFINKIGHRQRKSKIMNKDIIENAVFKQRMNQHDKCPEQEFQSKGHSLLCHQLSRSMPEQMIMEVVAEDVCMISEATAEHEHMISLRSSMIRQYKYPEAQSMPTPRKFTKSRPRPQFERARSVASIESLAIDLSKSLNHTAYCCFVLNRKERITTNPDDLQRPTQLASTWESIMGLDEFVAEPISATSGCTTPRGDPP